MRFPWQDKEEDDDMLKFKKRDAQHDEERAEIIATIKQDAKQKHAIDQTAKANREKEYVENRKKIYKMPYYDRIKIRDDEWVERVPGGWIFIYEDLNSVKADATTFIPYAEEALETFNKLQTDS